MPGYEVIDQKEFEEVKKVFDKGGILFRHGFDNMRSNSYKVKEFEEQFAQYFSVPHALAVTSGTAALRVALASLDIGHGDEVITQAFTFVATVEAIIESGATPLCCDIDESLNIDASKIEQLITPKTKAIIVVHMLGTPANLTDIKDICDKYNLRLIEDTAWGCGGSLQGQYLGTWGDIGTFSFDFAKTMTTGEGGMLIFHDEYLYKKAAAWHDHGHENNPLVPRWEDTRTSSGFNYRMMELQGAIGIVQLKKLQKVIESQRLSRDKIRDSIKHIQGISRRKEPNGSYDTADSLVFLVDNKETALKCRKELLDVGINTKILPEALSWHFAGEWNHMPQLIKSHGEDLKTAFKTSEEILSRCVSLPINVYMHENIPQLIGKALTKVFAN